MARRYATAAEVVAMAPEMDGHASLDAMLTLGRDFVGLDAWGDLASRGHALITAHLLAILPGSADVGAGAAAGGALTGEALGPASRSFAASPSSSDDRFFDESTYGRMFLALRRRIRRTGVAVLGGG